MVASQPTTLLTILVLTVSMVSHMFVNLNHILIDDDYGQHHHYKSRGFSNRVLDYPFRHLLLLRLLIVRCTVIHVSYVLMYNTIHVNVKNHTSQLYMV